MTSRKPNGYWRNEDNVKSEISKIIDKLGHYPGQQYLTENGHSCLNHAIQRYHHGLAKFREKMGHQNEKLPLGYWKNKENVVSNLEEIINSEYRDSNNVVIKRKGEFPTYSQLNKIGQGSLGGAMAQHGGVLEFKRLFNVESKTRPRDYWKDFNNVRKEAENLVRDVGFLPSKVWMEKNGYGSLANSVIQYHGGFHRLREKLGQKQFKKPPGYWKDFKVVERELEKMTKELGRFPTQKEIAETNWPLLCAIRDRHGGLNKTARRMGFKAKVNNDKEYVLFWSNFDNLERQIKPFIEETLKTDSRLPTINDYVEHGKMDIFNSIKHYHGSLYKVYKKMGYYEHSSLVRSSSGKPDGYWNNPENLKPELVKIIDNLGHFPTNRELRTLGKKYLIKPILKNGGKRKLAKVLDANLVTKPPGYWRVWENLKSEIEGPISDFYTKHDRLPFQSELKTLVSSTAISAASTIFGGLKKTYAKLGYLPLQSSEAFMHFLDSNDNMKYVVQKIGDDPVTLTDIVSIMYGDRMKRGELARFLTDRPSLRDYMGRFATGIRDFQDFKNLAKRTLPFDKDDKIKQILIKAGTELVIRNLGPKPSGERIESELKILESKLISTS